MSAGGTTGARNGCAGRGTAAAPAVSVDAAAGPGGDREAVSRNEGCRIGDASIRCKLGRIPSVALDPGEGKTGVIGDGSVDAISGPAGIIAVMPLGPRALTALREPVVTAVQPPACGGISGVCGIDVMNGTATAPIALGYDACMPEAELPKPWTPKKGGEYCGGPENAGREGKRVAPASEPDRNSVGSYSGGGGEENSTIGGVAAWPPEA